MSFSDGALETTWPEAWKNPNGMPEVENLRPAFRRYEFEADVPRERLVGLPGVVGASRELVAGVEGG